MLVIVMAICAGSCVLLLLELALRRTRPRRGETSVRRRTQSDRVPEEDRVHPVIDANGVRHWVADEDKFWHEIVSWAAPLRSPLDEPVASAHREAGQAM